MILSLQLIDLIYLLKKNKLKFILLEPAFEFNFCLSFQFKIDYGNTLLVALTLTVDI